jgi:hypothetical protein
MLFVLVPSLWLTVLTAVLAACRMAARADALPAGAANGKATTGEATARRTSAANTPATLATSRRDAQSPRRPTTCGTVRRRIFTSVHSDQFATYR